MLLTVISIIVLINYVLQSSSGLEVSQNIQTWRFSNISEVIASNDRQLLTLSNPLSFFRSNAGKGLRGFYHGGVFPSISAEECAIHCIADRKCLSFDVDSSDNTCYISHTDQYFDSHAFLNFPKSINYEWSGQVDSPQFEPNGGIYSTLVAVKIYSKKLGATIHYKIYPITTSYNIEPLNLVAPPKAEDLTSGPTLSQLNSLKDYSVAKNGEVIILPPYSCKIYAIAKKEGMLDSTWISSEVYHIYATKYLYLVPYFNSNFHGHVTRLQLDVRGKNRPRPARFHEFSDYESPMGIRPYANQAAVIDLKSFHPDYIGFRGGCTAFADTLFIGEKYYAPNPLNETLTIIKWRISLKVYFVPHVNRTSEQATEIVQKAEYLHLAPYTNGESFSGNVIRILTSTFKKNPPYMEHLNLTEINPALKGFVSLLTDDNKYLYLIPQENEEGLHGNLVRIELNSFNLSGVNVLNLTAINANFVGYSNAILYHNYLYMIPYLKPPVIDPNKQNMKNFPQPNSGLVVRINTNLFTFDGSIDLATFHPHLAGFSGAIRVTHYAYFIPYSRLRNQSTKDVNPFSGVIGRLDLNDFKSVAYLNLADIDDDLRGFSGGFAYKHYIFFVPFQSSYAPKSEGMYAESSKVVRLDTLDFTLHGISVLDLSKSPRSQVPDLPDVELRGFRGGVVSGKYGYFVPYFKGNTFSGKVCRVNLETFSEVQVLDLAMLDSQFRGFADGILSKTKEYVNFNQFGEFQIQPGSTTPYQHIY